MTRHSVTWIALATLALIGLVTIVILRARKSSDQGDTAAASTNGYESQEDAISRMVNLRRRHDKRIKKGPTAGRWMMWQLWVSPEGHILRSVCNVLWLQEGGMTTVEAWAHICPSAQDQIRTARDDIDAFRIGVRRILQVIDEDYLDLGDDLIDKISSVARSFGDTAVRDGNNGPPYPSRDWLIEQSTFEEFDALQLHQVDADGIITKTLFEATDMICRRLPTDQIWKYKSPGRAGYALVRKGRSIAHTVTSMY